MASSPAVALPPPSLPRVAAVLAAFLSPSTSSDERRSLEAELVALRDRPDAWRWALETLFTPTSSPILDGGVDEIGAAAPLQWLLSSAVESALLRRWHVLPDADRRLLSGAVFACLVPPARDSHPSPSPSSPRRTPTSPSASGPSATPTSSTASSPSPSRTSPARPLLQPRSAPSPSRSKSSRGKPPTSPRPPWTPTERTPSPRTSSRARPKWRGESSSRRSPTRASTPTRLSARTSAAFDSIGDASPRARAAVAVVAASGSSAAALEAVGEDGLRAIFACVRGAVRDAASHAGVFAEDEDDGPTRARRWTRRPNFSSNSSKARAGPSVAPLLALAAVCFAETCDALAAPTCDVEDDTSADGDENPSLANAATSAFRALASILAAQLPRLEPLGVVPRLLESLLRATASATDPRAFLAACGAWRATLARVVAERERVEDAGEDFDASPVHARSPAASRTSSNSSSRGVCTPAV